MGRPAEKWFLRYEVDKETGLRSGDERLEIVPLFNPLPFDVLRTCAWAPWFFVDCSCARLSSRFLRIFESGSLVYRRIIWSFVFEFLKIFLYTFRHILMRENAFFNKTVFFFFKYSFIFFLRINSSHFSTPKKIINRSTIF